MRQKILAMLTTVLTAGCGQPSDVIPAPESDAINIINLPDFTDTVWYDSVESGSSIFFDFENMREGIASDYTKSSDLDSHFGGPIVGCGNNEVHCMHGGFTFSIPRSDNVTEWSISGYDCTLVGTYLDGNVDCQDPDSVTQFEYWIVDEHISQFRLIVEDYPRDAFFLEHGVLV
jgi:hypothetical protein